MDAPLNTREHAGSQRVLIAGFIALVCAAVMFFAAPCEEAWAYVIKVNKGTQVATVYDDNGYPVRAMTVSTGATGNTPEGWFKSSDKYIWRDMIGGTYCQYVTRVTGSFLFHSVPYWSPTGSQMVARYFNALGTAVSAGCIRTNTENAKWVYDNCPSGTWFYIFYGTAANDPLGKPASPYINYAINDRAWDPTDPNPNNPYYMYPNGVTITNANGAGAFVGGTYRLAYSLTTRGMLNGLTDTVTWSSSNPSVATVDSTGLVTGVSLGTTTITARTVNAISTSCTFTVGPHVDSIALDDMEYLRGRTELLPVMILPAAAWLRTYTCSSSDTDVAELSTGVSAQHMITGKSVGTTTISVATTDGNHAASTVATIYDYTVIYEDYNGTPISTQHIGYGEEVVVPENPVRVATDEYDYSFVGWDKVFDRNTHTITNTAV
ncbi:MAG: L,D-transpeptidase family protein, partial [Actinobacteria bacterium]|nr:L,D-transpeptidase family protein [Actinomycetota bacterium]